MAFTPTELTVITEITGVNYLTLSTVYAPLLNEAQEARVREDIDLWENVKKKTTRLEGGAGGIVTDPELARRLVRERVMRHLGLTHLINGSSIGSVQVASSYD